MFFSTLDGRGRRQDVSFWDAVIVRSAGKLECATLYSENLNPGQRYEGVAVRNPFVNP